MFFKASAWALLLLLLYGLFATAAKARQKVHRQEVSPAGQRASKAAGSTPEIPSQPFLLNASEGLSVIGAALESRGRGYSKRDCSHLVHAVYERAGFPYS